MKFFTRPNDPFGTWSDSFFEVVDWLDEPLGPASDSFLKATGKIKILFFNHTEAY